MTTAAAIPIVYLSVFLEYWGLLDGKHLLNLLLASLKIGCSRHSAWVLLRFVVGKLTMIILIQFLKEIIAPN